MITAGICPAGSPFLLFSVQSHWRLRVGRSGYMCTGGAENWSHSYLLFVGFLFLSEIIHLKMLFLVPASLMLLNPGHCYFRTFHPSPIMLWRKCSRCFFYSLPTPIPYMAHHRHIGVAAHILDEQLSANYAWFSSCEKRWYFYL